MSEVLTATADRLERHRTELTAHCGRMLGSRVDAEDAVQETFVRAWSSFHRYEGRAPLRSWLYRIATNVCLDMLSGRRRAAVPVAEAPVAAGDDPADVVVAHETVRLALVAALRRLPPRQRAALLLCEVLRWKADEAAELLETSVAAVNSALQRARAALADARLPGRVDGAERGLLARYVEAFEAYDVDRLASLIREDAMQEPRRSAAA